MTCFPLDRELAAQNVRWVIGCDEVGRGCLAGPVVVGAVLMDLTRAAPDGLRDSKRMTPLARRRMVERLREVSPWFAIGAASPEEIDRLGIQQATVIAAMRSLAFAPSADALVIDAFSIPGRKAIVLPKAESASSAVAAASVLAKMFRDDLCVYLDALFPDYGFAKHKGYPTREHLEALKRFGPSPVHRYSFAPVARVHKVKTLVQTVL